MNVFEDSYSFLKQIWFKTSSLKVFFVALASHLLVLDGFGQLLRISCTIHTLSSALLPINLSDIKKFEIGNAENRTLAGWVRSVNAASVLSPPPSSFKSLRDIKLYIINKCLKLHGSFNLVFNFRKLKLVLLLDYGFSIYFKAFTKHAMYMEKLFKIALAGSEPGIFWFSLIVSQKQGN